MPWVNINGHRYYRRSRRVNGRVVTEHVGGDRMGELAAGLDEAKRKVRQLDGWKQRLDFDRFLFSIQDCLAVDEAVSHVFTLLAERSGAYRHRRQWRWTRGGRRMSNDPANAAKSVMAALARCNLPPLMAPDFVGIPEEDQVVLREAAKGDVVALEKSRKYLTDQRFTRRWGNPAHAARWWLMIQAAGTNVVVASATLNFADRLTEDLGFGQANTLEQLAITRVVNNWLMVGTLEAKACGLPLSSKERGRVERCLSQADRRLMQAVKALSFLRGVKAAEIVARLPHASTIVAPTPATQN